jgi:PAS domain S-box-containing protein
MNRRLPTRDAIIAAADLLFETRGVRETAVELVAGDAGVTKRTLYNHFESKDELIAESLKLRSMRALSHLRRAAEVRPGPVVARIIDLLTSSSTESRAARTSCASVARVAVELAGMPGHPAHAVIASYRLQLRDWIAEMLREEEIDGWLSKATTLAAMVDALLGRVDIGSPGSNASASLLAAAINAVVMAGGESAMKAAETSHGHAAVDVNPGRYGAILGAIQREVAVLREQDGTIEYWSRGAARLYGYQPSEAVGRPIDDLLKTEFQGSRSHAEIHLRDNGSWRGLLVQQARTGTRLVVSGHWTLQPLDGGHLILELHHPVEGRPQ